MADIRRLVERIVESDPVIKKGLQRKIINSRALARYILESDGVTSTADSILGIIRRYPLASEKDRDHQSIFKYCEIAMRNKVADLAIENGPDVMKRVAEFAATIKTTRGENLRIIVGLQSIRVIAEQKILDPFMETLRKSEVISYATNLAEISLLFPPESSKVKGIAAKITAQLVLNDVNLAGILCCAPEDIIVVSEDDAPRALEALQQLIKDEAKSSRHEAAKPKPLGHRTRTLPATNV